jgi:hypothetical protein
MRWFVRVALRKIYPEVERIPFQSATRAVAVLDDTVGHASIERRGANPLRLVVPPPAPFRMLMTVRLRVVLSETLPVIGMMNPS